MQLLQTFLKTLNNVATHIVIDQTSNIARLQAYCHMTTRYHHTHVTILQCCVHSNAFCLTTGLTEIHLLVSHAPNANDCVYCVNE